MTINLAPVGAMCNGPPGVREAVFLLLWNCFRRNGIVTAYVDSVCYLFYLFIALRAY